MKIARIRTHESDVHERPERGVRVSFSNPNNLYLITQPEQRIVRRFAPAAAGLINFERWRVYSWGEILESCTC